MKKFKCLVKGCSHVTKTISGLTSHVKTHHHTNMVLGETYEKTHEPVTNPNRNGPFKAKKRKPVATPVITAATKFIDVPCTIRVSVSGLKVQGISLAG